LDSLFGERRQVNRRGVQNKLPTFNFRVLYQIIDNSLAGRICTMCWHYPKRYEQDLITTNMEVGATVFGGQHGFFVWPSRS
jgi:hypothetical protein